MWTTRKPETSSPSSTVPEIATGPPSHTGSSRGSVQRAGTLTFEKSK